MSLADEKFMAYFVIYANRIDNQNNTNAYKNINLAWR